MASSDGKSLRGARSDDLAFTLVALLRTHGHLCNVLTHIASGDWRAVEQAIAAILEPRISPKKLSPLARNLLELLCDNRGVSGRIMRPFFFAAVAGAAGKAEMRRIELKIRRLRARMASDPRAPSARRTLRRGRGRRPARHGPVPPFSAVVAAPSLANGVHRP